MSKQIENRVVRMEFDNANFEKNIKVTSDTLKKFNKELEFKDAGKNFSNVEKSVSSFSKKADTEIGNVKKGVSTLQSTISKFTWEPMTAGIESVKLKFSAMQVAAATAVSKITNSVMNAGTKLKNSTWGQITSGGSSRATNIENAKFKIENLVRDNTKGKTAAEQAQIDAKNTKKAAETWKQAYENMDYAVSGTAYGIDAAASAASQLMASGVKLGDEMKTSLRAISGVAAMTGSTYEDISAIFTSAAGKGKVQADELNRISVRGINATATLANKLETTEETVREMAKNGEIDFKTFARAMDEAFGESATRANDTFQGAMSNVKAALSRIGEPFYTVAHKNLRLSFVKLIPVINKFKNAISAKDSKGNIKKDSIVGVFTQATDFLREKFVGAMNRIKGDNTIETYIGNIGKTLNRNLGNFKSVVNNSISIFKNIKDTVSHFITPLHDAFISIFPSKNELGFIASAVNMVKIVIEDFTQAIKDAVHNKDVKGNYESNKLTTFFKGIFSVVRIAWKGLSFFVKTARKASNIITPILSIIATGFEKIGEGLLWITDKIEKSEKVRIILDFLSRAAGSLKDNISDAIKAASPFTKWVKDTYNLVKTKLEPVFKSARETIGGFTDGIFKAMDSAFRNTSGVLMTASAAAKDAKDEIKKTTNDIKDAVNSTGDTSFLSMAWDGISWLFEKISDGFKAIKNAFSSDTASTVWDGIKTTFSKIGEIASLIWNQVSPMVKKAFKSLTDASSGGLDSIIEYLKTHDITGFIEKITKIFLTGASARTLWKLSDAGIFKSTATAFDSVTGLLRSIGASISNLTGAISNKINAKKKIDIKEILKTVAEILKALAITIGVIAASLFVLSFVDPKKLEASSEALGKILIVIGLISVLLVAFSKKMSGKNSSTLMGLSKKGISVKSNKSIFDAIAGMITAIGTGVLMIAVAAKVMSTIDKNRFGDVVANIYVILGVLTLMMAALISLPKVLNLKDKELENIPKIIESFSKLLKSISKVFIKMALVVVILGKTMTAGQLIKGVLALGAMAAIIAMLMYAAAELDDSLTSTDSVIIGEKSMKESSVTKMTAFSKLLKSISDAFLKMGVVVLAIGKLTDTGSWFRGIGGLVTMGLIVAGLMYATKWISDDSLGSDTVDNLKTKSKSFIGGKLFKKEGVSDSSFNASSDTAITRIRNMTKFISTISNAFIKMGVVCVALAKLTDFDGWGRAMISIVTFAALIAGIMLATKKIDADGFDKVSKSIFIISGALAVMAAAFIAISKLTWPELGKGIVGLIAFITLIAGAAVVTSITKTGDAIAKLSKSIMYLGIGMAGVAASIFLFTAAWKLMETMKLDSNVLVKGVTAIFSALPGILKGLISGVVDMLISFIFDVITALTNRMTELMEAIGKFLTAFIKAVRGLSSEFSLDEVIEALAAIAIVFAMFMMLTLISKNAKGALKGLAMAAILIAGLTVVFSLLLNGNKGIGQDALGIGVGMAAIIAAISSASLAMAELGKLAPDTKTMLAGVKAFFIGAAVVLAVIGVLALLGAAVDALGWKEGIIKGLKTSFEILNTVAEELGKFIGNFVGGIAEGLLPKLGTSLSIFMKNMGGFFEGAKKISKPSMEAVLTMAGAIAALLGGTLLNAASSAVTNPLAYISSWIGIDTTDMSPLVKMGKELTAFAPYIVNFANKITEIKDPKKAEETASSIGKIIDNLQKYLPWEVNAFWGAFTKKKINLSDFGKSMAGFLGDSENKGGFIEFVNKMKDVDVPSELVTKAQNIGKMIKALQENLPWKIEAFWDFWGMKGSFSSQQTSLEDFGESMSGFASYFVSFATSISGVSDSAFNKGKLVADMVSTMATSMGQETTATGFLGFFSSKKESLTNFASDLKDATPNFKTFLESIDELTLPKDGTDKVDTLLKLITSFATFKEEGHTGWDTSWIQDVFIGHTGSLSTFATELSDAIPGFTKLSKSITDGEWSIVTEDQNKAVTSVVQLVGTMVKTLSNDDLKWDKLSDTAVTNMQAIREFLVGYFKLGDDAEYDNSHWEGPSDNPSAVGKKAYYTNTYVGGLLDIVIDMSKKLNSVDIPNSTVLSNASSMISKILEMLSEENFKVIKEITGLNSDYDFSNLYTLMNEYGDGLVAIMSAFSGYTLSPSYRTLTTDDVNRFKDLAGSIEEVFKAWDNIKDLVSTDEQGDLSVAVGKACGIIQSFIDKFAGLNYKISETNSTNFLDFVKTFVNDYANIDDKKLQRINVVNEAFKNVTGNALSAVMSEKTDYTKSEDVINLTRHYNNIIINALNAVKSSLNADDPILNGVNLKSTYGFGNRFMAIISMGLNKKNNLLTNGILDSIKEAYNESAKHVRNPQETKDSAADHNFFKLGEYIALGISNGMKNKTSIVIETAKSLALDAYDASKKALEINSPSKLFMRLYSQIPEGAALGISNESRQVLNSIDTMTTTTFDRAKMAISKFPGFIDGSYSPTIAPVVDMSDFNSQYKSFSPLLSDTKVNVDAKTLRDLNDISSKLNYNNEQKILVDNSDVVNAVSNLDKRFTELEDYISGLTISLDSSKVVGGISKKMNNALGDDMYMQYRGV